VTDSRYVVYTEYVGENERRFKENPAAVHGRASRIGIWRCWTIQNRPMVVLCMFGWAFGCLVLYRHALSFSRSWSGGHLQFVPDTWPLVHSEVFPVVDRTVHVTTALQIRSGVPARTCWSGNRGSWYGRRSSAKKAIENKWNVEVRF